MWRLLIVCSAVLGLVACDSDSPSGQAEAVSEARDAAIALDIRTRFLGEKYRFSFLDVETNVLRGRVLLSGTVETSGERVSAAVLAGAVSGVREVVNEIQIAPGGQVKDPGPDVATETRIARRLARVAGSRARNYRWHSVNGVVYLIGIAQDRRELEEVVSAAREISRAGKVVNHARVR